MIVIDNLSFNYGSNRVLSHISMTLEDGRIYGLLGENGVGKTTLLTLLAGFKKPSEGSVRTDGMVPYRRQPSFLEDQFFLADEVLPVNSSAENFGKTRGSFWPRFKEDRYLQILREFEVDPGWKMNKMSSGQLKKTYIAFTLSLGVKHLFMDEPTNGLDIPSKSEFRKAVTKYTAEDSLVVISTHQVRDLENIIDPIIILDKREVLANISMEGISSKLFFDYGNTLRPEALYSEQLPGGFIQVVPNTTGEESKVNIEAFFNAVHAHKDLLKNLLK